MLLKFMALLISIVPMVSAQDNVLHQGEAADSQSVIVTTRTRAFLSCESGDIVVKVNFTQPFRGLMYAHRSRNSPCRVHGTGRYYYQLRIPLKGCGTWQESPRVFVNNITIRFHPALELEEDETKTVVCRYPPPLTPPPGSIHVIEPVTFGPSPVPTRVGTAKLSEVEILIIICLLLFLSLLTLGIGIAYFCLKRRNIHIVRKGTVVSSAPPSQITRLSSSNVPPPSSLLSSVLGHTVRIPRAVPYSAPVGRTPSSVLSSPDHHYEEYPASTSTTSGEVSETSVSSSSEDQPDASKNLLFKKVGPRSLLSIPKAILRKTGPKKWRAEPAVHNYYSQTAVGTSVRRPEMEDQTVITVLEPEVHADDDHRYWSVRNGTAGSERQDSREINELHKSDAPKKPVPVYAQVDKNKKTSAKSHEINIEKLNITKPEPRTTPRLPARPTILLGAARRQRTVIADIPEESSTSEEITKNTTVTTSVRREVKETRIISPHLNVPSDSVDDGMSELSTGGTDSRLSHTDNTTVQTVDQQVVPHQPTRNILIRDVEDIYLTTTVETESRELTTHVSRDIVEEHTRKDSSSTTPTPKEVPKSPELTPTPEAPSPTDHWNVVIRQRKPPPNLYQQTPPSTDTDTNSDSGDTAEDLDVKPMFDVKIRAIPPEELKPKEPQKMVSIPLLEMPQTISKLKEALTPKTVESSPATKLPTTDSPLLDDKVKNSPESKDKANLPQRTVRWLDDTKASARDKDTVSSSDSFQSAESLRERSSSEVLEVAPTLPSHRRNSDHPMLERSTSEIVTSPEDHVRWVGGVVPVLETLSPEFLANIPVVIQGGFFNRQKTPSPDNRQKTPSPEDTKKPKSKSP